MKPPQIKITYSHRLPISKLPRIVNVSEATELCKSLYDKGTIGYEEEFHIVILNNNLRVLGTSRVSCGGRDTTLVDIAKVATIALKANAKRVIITHNHPSGVRQPSEDDIRLTKQIKSALELFGIQLIDHIIVTSDNGVFSFGHEDIM